MADLSAVSERSTRVRADVAGPTAGPFGNVAQKLADHKAITQLYVVAFGTGSLGVLFDLAYRSILPSLVPAVLRAEKVTGAVR